MEHQETAKITLGLVVSWLLGVAFLIIGFVLVFYEAITGVLLIIAGGILLPALNQLLQQRFKFSLSGGLKSVLAVILVIVAVSVFSPNDTSNLAREDTQPSAPSETAQKTTQPPQQKDNVATETPKPQPQEAPASPAKSCQPVFTFSGIGAKKSEPFTITGSRFKIKYDCSGDFSQAWLGKPGGGFFSEVIMNAAGPLKDETIVYGAGTYYIQANTIGSYTMVVEDYR